VAETSFCQVIRIPCNRVAWLRIAVFGERVFFHRAPMGRRMSKEGIATLQHASMGLLCDPRKQEEILNDLWVVWVKLALELELENIVRRRFPGHSEGAYGRLERCIDELGFIGSDVRFLAQRLWSVIVNWFAAGAFTKPIASPFVNLAGAATRQLLRTRAKQAVTRGIDGDAEVKATQP
jgi:hypothetical protein